MGLFLSVVVVNCEHQREPLADELGHVLALTIGERASLSPERDWYHHVRVVFATHNSSRNVLNCFPTTSYEKDFSIVERILRTSTTS